MILATTPAVADLDTPVSPVTHALLCCHCFLRVIVMPATAATAMKKSVTRLHLQQVFTSNYSPQLAITNLL